MFIFDKQILDLEGGGRFFKRILFYKFVFSEIGSQNKILYKIEFL